MKTPFQFPNYEEWVNTHENTVGHLIHRKIWNGPTTYYAPQTYALFYLLALRDWVNEGWAWQTSPTRTLYRYSWVNIAYDRFLEEWVCPRCNGTSRFVDNGNLLFPNKKCAEEFLSHKSDTTDTITQLNILYDIKN